MAVPAKRAAIPPTSCFCAKGGVKLIKGSRISHEDVIHVCSFCGDDSNTGLCEIAEDVHKIHPLKTSAAAVAMLGAWRVRKQMPHGCPGIMLLATRDRQDMRTTLCGIEDCNICLRMSNTKCCSACHELSPVARKACHCGSPFRDTLVPTQRRTVRLERKTEAQLLTTIAHTVCSHCCRDVGIESTSLGWGLGSCLSNRAQTCTCACTSTAHEARHFTAGLIDRGIATKVRWSSHIPAATCRWNLR